MLNIFKQKKKENLSDSVVPSRDTVNNAKPEIAESKLEAALPNPVQKLKKRFNFGPDKPRHYIRKKRRVNRLQKLARRIRRRYDT